MGPILRLLLVGVAIWLLFRIWRFLRYQSDLQRRAGGELEDPVAPQDARLTVENVVPCAVCGVHIPEQEAIRRNGRVYCSPEHRDVDQVA